MLLFVAAVVPLRVIGDDPTAPYEQEFVVTAYYSPKPYQCCYVKGSYEADQVLNGKGYVGADGTPVFAGMIAAPSLYAFGTAIELPGLGMFTVHDRGGRITTLADGRDRIDIWVGEGEEGLARAMKFGIQTMKGTVFPAAGSLHPPVRFTLDTLPAPHDRLRTFFVAGTGLLSLKPKINDRTLSVVLLQEKLQETGYFHRSPTGYFGPETQGSLAAFIRDYALSEGADTLGPTTAAFLLSAAQRSDAPAPVSDTVDRSSAPKVISQAQRILRSLGYYHGRTNGQYDDRLFQSILAFQKDHGLAGDEKSVGAGRIGPLTKKALTTVWNRSLVSKRAKRYGDFLAVSDHLRKTGGLPTRFLREGDSGPSVRLLQQLLAERGFFPANKINGQFGPLTREAVLAYQLDRNLVEDEANAGAGTVGPATLTLLTVEETKELYGVVRSEGWKAL